MLYMLDTDICSYLMRNTDPRLIERLDDESSIGNDIGISVITYGELRSGAERSSASAKYHSLIDALGERLSFIASWDVKSADIFAQLHAALQKAGTPIGVNDTMIAAHALALGGTLITNNERHFSRVDVLRVENWTASLGG